MRSCCAEVLPLVQFYLEEGIGDEEAVSLIDLEVPPAERSDAPWQHLDNGNPKYSSAFGSCQGRIGRGGLSRRR